MVKHAFFLVGILIFGVVILSSLGENITDRYSYMTSIENSSSFINVRLINKDLITVLLNDPLWVLFLAGTFFLDIDTETAVILVSFLGFVLTWHVIVYRIGLKLDVFFVLVSYVFLANYITHIRQGLALSITLIFLYGRLNPSWILASGLFHNSFFVLAPLIWVRNKFKITLSNIHLYVFGGVISLFVIVLLFESSRQEYFSDFHMKKDAIGFGWLFWLTVYASRILVFRNSLVDFVSVVLPLYLIFYFIEPTVAGRMMEVLVLFLILDIRRTSSLAISTSYSLLFFILSWVSNYSSNFYGFAV